jgi:probable F420-dependent oxidoreductase
LTNIDPEHTVAAMRIGAKLPNSGALAVERAIPAMARSLEQSGVDSIWVSDHVILPESIDSRYPFAADGRATWPSDTPYVEALIALALAAAVTTRVALGTAVLVLPMRNPVIFAKQAASIDVASGGRLRVGVGVGWLAEEFEALDAPFADRGARLDEWIEIARACWTGRPAAHRSQRYALPAGVVALPVPTGRMPVLVGGHSRAALRRAGRIGDGWLAQQSLDELDPDELVAGISTMRAAAAAAGRDSGALELVLRIVGSAGRGDDVAGELPRLAAAGVSEIIVDAEWDADGPASDLARLAAAGSA